jgi:hypothetical protein
VRWLRWPPRPPLRLDNSLGLNDRLDVYGGVGVGTRTCSFAAVMNAASRSWLACLLTLSGTVATEPRPRCDRGRVGVKHPALLSHSGGDASRRRKENRATGGQRSDHVLVGWLIANGLVGPS